MITEEKRLITIYIKNRRISIKFKGFDSYQSLCFTESFVLRNRLLFILTVRHNSHENSQKI